MKNPERILIIGATSAIAEATARLYAKQGARLYLLARDEERLATLASDLKISGATETHFGRFDATDFEHHTASLDNVYAALGHLDLALIAHGTLSDQPACEKDLTLLRREFETNALSVMTLLTDLAQRFSTQGSGTLAVISSVAGDRGRQSNYVYGAAKGAVSLFLQGLRNRLTPHGVQVLTIKPGFVDTPMTASFKKGALWASPEKIANGIVKAVNKQKDIVYLPGFWRGIMLIIRLIPETIFKKLKL